GTASGVSIRDVKVNVDHSVTATFTAPAVVDPCSDVVCAALEQCIEEGALAGNCVALEATIPDAGPIGQVVTGSGCSSTGAPGLAGLAIGLGLAAASLLRRNTP